MNTLKIRKSSFVILLTVLMVVTIVGTVSAIRANIFNDVPDTHPFANYISWLKDNGITSGYADGTYRPNNPITRGEMAKMLNVTASTVVAAGAHVEPKTGGGYEITEWFNNVTYTKPVYNLLPPVHSINFGIDLTERFFACTVDGTDSATALCSVSQLGAVILVDVYDVKEDSHSEPIGFWILVYGKENQK